MMNKGGYISLFNIHIVNLNAHTICYFYKKTLREGDLRSEKCLQGSVEGHTEIKNRGIVPNEE